jgi:hypothetical protein
VKVKMLRNPSSAFGCDFLEGQIGVVDDVVGKALLSARIAIEIEPSMKTQKPASQKVENEPDLPEIKAVPTAPAIAEEKPAENKSSQKTSVAETKKPKASSTDANDAKPQNIRNHKNER